MELAIIQEHKEDKQSKQPFIHETKLYDFDRTG